MLIVKAAIKNILRNPERSLLTLSMICVSTAGLILFRAFTDDTIHVIKKVATEMQFGHLQVAKTKFWENSFETRSEALISNVADLKSIISSQPLVTSVSPRLNSFGLISAGAKTENASFLSFSVKAETGMADSLQILEGNYLSQDEKSPEIIIGHLLAKKLGLKLGQTITALVNTVDDVINAKEFKVVGFFASGTDEIDKYFAYLSISHLQDLLQTESADLLVIKTQDVEKIDQSALSIRSALEGSDHKSLEVKTWVELSELFRKVKDFYDTQNRIIRIIIMMIVILGILNTVAMNIFERIGEIGTMKALGASNLYVGNLFLLESVIMSIVGTAIGSLTAFIMGYSINNSNITTEIPGASLPIKVQFLFSLPAFSEAIIIIVLTTAVSSIPPLIKAMRMTIVSSLNRNL